MTDRHRGYVVTLDQDIREDDAEAIINAIKMVKHVLTVRPVIADFEGHMAEDRVRMDLKKRLWEALESKTR